MSYKNSSSLFKPLLLTPLLMHSFLSSAQMVGSGDLQPPFFKDALTLDRPPITFDMHDGILSPLILPICQKQNDQPLSAEWQWQDVHTASNTALDYTHHTPLKKVRLTIRPAITDQHTSNHPDSLLLVDPLSPPCETENLDERLQASPLSLIENPSEYYIKSTTSEAACHPTNHKNDTPTLFVGIDDNGILYIMVVEILSDGSIHIRQLPIASQYMIDDIDAFLDELSHLHNVSIVPMGQVVTIKATNKNLNWTIETKESAAKKEEQCESLQPLKQLCPIAQGNAFIILTPGKAIQCMMPEGQTASSNLNSNASNGDPEDSEPEEGEIREDEIEPPSSSTDPEKPYDPELLPDDQAAITTPINDDNIREFVFTDLRTILKATRQLRKAEEILKTQARKATDLRVKIELNKGIEFIKRLLNNDPKNHEKMIDIEIQRILDTAGTNNNYSFWPYTVAILEQCNFLDSAEYFMERMRYVIPEDPDLAKALIWHLIYKGKTDEASKTLKGWSTFTQYNDWLIAKLFEMVSVQNIQLIKERGFNFFGLDLKDRKRHSTSKSNKSKRTKY
ncbi:hypothetical protein ACH42_16295 [Endozoicomonas sp. (ex Bugula neritina AB1)]|nr:hypothetical protein ACH42_16295 [Endozoicomonas sp. (ex Bugula neritina AB1)]